MDHQGDNDDDDDYMSDKVLSQCRDIRPGLYFNQSAKKKVEMEEKQKILNDANRVKPRKQLEEERRVEGLNSALSCENKGYSLLQKMGYKPGMALGKKGTGKTDPVPINIKAGRGGLGREEVLKRRLESKQAMLDIMQRKKQKFDDKSAEDFRSRASTKMAEKRNAADLKKSQKVCEYLDKEMGIDQPIEKWYWLPIQTTVDDTDETESETEEEEDECQLEPEDMLELLTTYLRSTHMYCIWCGMAYEDEADMLDNCPGNTSDVH